MKVKLLRNSLRLEPEIINDEVDLAFISHVLNMKMNGDYVKLVFHAGSGGDPFRCAYLETEPEKKIEEQYEPKTREMMVEYLTNKHPDEVLPTITCDSCRRSNSCAYAYHLYNTNGYCFLEATGGER